MSSELSVLALYGLWMIIVLLAQVLAASAQVGLVELAKPRDEMPKLTGLAGRLDRAQMNCVVAMVLFAPAVLLLSVQSGFTAATLLAAQIFLIARIFYVLLYAAGIAWLRTAVWVAGFFATAYLYLIAL